jgi:hypothetical protein
MIRFILFLACAILLVYCGTTVRLGDKTAFGHIRAIWKTDEAQDMKRGVEESAKPMVEKVKRGVEAGYREATRDGAVEPAVEADPPEKTPELRHETPKRRRSE